MTLDTFFKKFDQFADAPDAVVKMRELVLELAATGRLIPEVLERPVDEEAKLMGSVVELVMGQAPAGDEYNTEGRGTVFVKVGEFGPLYPRKEVWTTKPLKFAKKGDVLVCVVGATVGKLNLAIDCAIGRSAAAIRPTSSLDTKFLYYSLIPYTLRLRRNSRGSAQGAIGKAELNAILLWVPTLAVQKRIVAKVDELMALCDRLEAQQQESDGQASALARASLARFAEAPTPANLNLLFHKSYSISPADLRKAVLAMAVRGKLVPQDPKDEPAARLLQRIDAAPKRAMRTRISGEVEGDEPTEFKPLFKLPRGWEWSPFRRLPLHASVGLDRGRSMQGPDKAVGYFKMNNIRNSGGVDLSDLTRIDATPDEIEAFALEDGDFLFNTRNSRELVGKTCVFRSPSSDPILNNNNILRVKFIDGFSPDFLDYWFRSPEGSAELEKLKSNTTNVCAIYQGKLSGFPCVVPPLAEQHRIVAKVDQLMAFVDQLETQLAASRATAKNLLEAVVAELTQAKTKR